MFGWKRSSCLLNHLLLPGAYIPIVDELVLSPAVAPRVIGSTYSQEIGCQIARHYLASIYKYVRCEKAKCEHSCEKKRVNYDAKNAMEIVKIRLVTHIAPPFPRK